ncbi:MAG: ATP-binding cassette domain-containing protein [Deltaproteobacteria bacterium]|nr:ATP-binding cassette domain-containing protein [Deltaproteobacteria bacterium]
MATRIAELLKPWYPGFRPVLIALIVAAAVSSGLTYLQNGMLHNLTLALSAPAGATTTREVPAWLSRTAAWIGIGTPFVALLFFIVLRLTLASVDYVRQRGVGHLQISARNALEGEILDALLRKDDAFLSLHPPAEIISRLSRDVMRAVDWRPNTVQFYWSAALLLGNLGFLVAKDWRLALVGIAACAAAMLWAARLARPVEYLDLDYLARDDRIKARFEDFLRATAEIQTGRFHSEIRRSYIDMLPPRTRTYYRITHYKGLRLATDAIAALLGLASLMAVVLYMRSAGAHGRAIGLLPVVIMALPDLLVNSARLASLRLDFALARNSARRLVEYAEEGGPPAAKPAEAPPEASAAAPAAAPAAPPAPLSLNEATFRYQGPDGTPQGGIVDVTTNFAPGRWTAIVGGAGSGKSTLMQLVLGRVAPQAGTVTYAGKSLTEYTEAEAGAIFSFMPQKPALLDASIAENLLFGQPPADGRASRPEDLAEADLELLEEAGLGGVCRLKALDLTPGKEPSVAVGDVPALRRRIRSRVQERCGVEIQGFEAGHCDPHHWVLETLLGGRCDQGPAVTTLVGPEATAPLARLMRTDLGQALVDLGASLVAQSSALLDLPGHEAFSKLAPIPVDERIWKLRVRVHDLDESHGTREPRTLLLVALTGALVEMDEDERRLAGLRAHDAAALNDLRDCLGPTWVRHEMAALHPFLSWRDNLVFGVVAARNNRALRRTDETLLEALDAEGLGLAFTRLGLSYQVGRLGQKLSGGQGQLVALCRTLLRHTSVVVLDEPTSALDPASRARVAKLLRRAVDRGLLLTITHDPEFCRAADEARLIQAGRLIASGAVKELEASNETFRRLLNAG